jgi:glycosidase
MNRNYLDTLQNQLYFNFHVSLLSRVKYEFDDSLFSIHGDLIISNFKLARELALKINQKREEEKTTGMFTTAGQINALGLLHEIFHFVIRHYEENENPGVFSRSIEYLKIKLGEDSFNKVIKKFVVDFPPPSVKQKILTVEEYLSQSTGDKPNTEIIIEELILLHLENINLPFKALKELFDDEDLNKETNYSEFLVHSENFFETEKPMSLEGESLINTLKKPILSNLNSIDGQLEYIKNKWDIIVEEAYLMKILGGTDLIKEDAKIYLPHGGTGTPPVPEYKILTKQQIEEIKTLSPEEAKLKYHFEYENFTQDIDWMPNVVMIAKNTFVWLDQLSKKYQRDISRLDQIPDEELDQFKRWNITSLWLIGLWERSSASRKIKQFCGNPEAASSAYSLFDYEVAHELGGEDAFQNLKFRCWIRNIRLASDMVPNHTGIFSKWILDNPGYFIQSSHPPFPVYSFTGPDLSDDYRYQIRIEDRYYTKQDAAVVFQLIENNSGKVRYLYHGNDGTNMPWNDTAQLNLLNPEVREALIQKIMHVASKTSIIRFDAAMTLTKLHYSRLWFPAPGYGGAIPSRSDYALTPEEFNRVMPKEFWREVVDRINTEMPQTLLLAEAFWLLEGYFVRTLGMHRVYNSAFMHMFMKEENDKFRKLIKNTLEFNPEILKRYVNFMSNPDEETAINQFGKGDKYFGVAVMMITLPGLPMIAHGQVEGFTEKYGMEYKKAYYNEFIDEYLVKRHEAEIFPLLKKRYLFSQVYNFELFDFIDEDGNLNENVFAFSNMVGNERVLVFYNNSYEQTTGKIKYSSGKVISYDDAGQPKEIANKTLGSALQLKSNHEHFYIFKDHKTNLEFIRSAKDLYEDGLSVQLNGYQYHVFMDFREVYDITGEYRKLCIYLNGKGIESIYQALLELNLLPLHNAVVELFSKEVVEEFKSFCWFKDQEKNIVFSNYLNSKISALISEVRLYNKVQINETEIISKIREDMLTLRELNLFINEKSLNDKTGIFKELKQRFIFNDIEKGQVYEELFIIYIVIRRILLSLKYALVDIEATKLFDNLLMSKPIWQSLLRLGNSYDTIKQEFDLLKILAASESIFPKEDSYIGKVKNIPKTKCPEKEEKFSAIQKLLNQKEVKNFIGFNLYNNIQYYSKENFSLLLNWFLTFELIRRTEKLSKQKIKETSQLEQAEIGKALRSTKLKSMAQYLLTYTKQVEQISEDAGFEFTGLINRWVDLNNSRLEKNEIIV